MLGQSGVQGWFSNSVALLSMWFVWSKLGKTEPIFDGLFRIEIIDTRLRKRRSHQPVRLD
jgi:hypothetical protein